MADDIAIKVEAVSKNFVLPHEKISSIKGMFTGAIKKRSKKVAETQHALKDISFEIKKGEFFGIVGRNGSGKSTLLKILAGIYQPTSGTTVTHGKLVPFIELGVGFNPELTGRENVYLNGAMLGFSKKEVEAMYQDIVTFAELERFMDQKLKNYSSGMQVRLAFSMATRAQADVLLVDEVLAVGDADFQRKCFSYFKQLKQQKKTVVFVSHDMNAVREYCDRSLLIDNSEVKLIGTPQKIAGEYAKLFIQDSQSSGTSESSQERWGEGSARVTEPKIRVLNDHKEVSLEFTVDCARDVEDPIIGYYYVNEQGQQICGTNTLILDHEVAPFRAGKKYPVKFTMENIFSDGLYYVTPAILSNGGAVVVDWWVNPAEVEIKRPQHVSYLVDAPVLAKIGEAI